MSARVSSLLAREGRRTPATWAAILLHEVCCFVLTQLPLFDRLGKAQKITVGPPIVYAHGYGQNCGSFWALARALSAVGRGPMFAYDYSSFDDIGSSADALGRFIQAVRHATGAASVDLIGHSMGGLVIVEHLRRAGGQHCVRRCITLASPRGGIRWPGPVPGLAASQLRRGSGYLRNLAAARLPIPVLNVSSEYDGVVYPAAASPRQDARDVRISGVGHVGLLFSKEMFQLAAGFLGEEDPVLELAG